MKRFGIASANQKPQNGLKHFHTVCVSHSIREE